MNKFPLNPQQQAALESMAAFVGGGEEQFYSIKGYAGTGKTSTVQRLVPLIQAMGKRVAFSAPTHKAVKVLAAMARRNSLDVPCATIHSLLSLKVRQDQENERIERDPKGKESVRQYDVVVIDECSMIGKELLGYIRRAADAHGTRFILMGDPAQLPPVGEDISPTFDIDGAMLAQVMRQRGEHPILGLCTDIRTMMEAGEYRFPAVAPQCDEPGEIGLHVMAGGYFREYMPVAFSHENFDANPDRFRVIAWTNQAVEGYNREIQAFRYPGLREPFADGEPIVFSKPAMSRSAVGLEKTYESDIIASTEMEGFVRGAPVRERHPAYPEIDAWRIVAELESGVSVNVWTLDRPGASVRDAVLRALAEKARAKAIPWWDYWALRESFAEIRPAYAMTAHKSQGSTFENVFVDALNIWRNPNKAEALQCLYVACSRASHHLILNAGGLQ